MRMSNILKSKDFEQKLLNNEIDLEIKNSKGYTLFLYAATREKYTVQLELILQHQKEKVQQQAHKQHSNALIIATLNNNLEGTKVLLRHGFDINIQGIPGQGETPLTISARNNNFDLVQFLVANGANINSKNYAKTTSLMYATQNQNIEMVRFLIENNAEINEVGSNGSALKKALLSNADEIIKLLIENGADIKKVCSGLEPALNISAQEGNIDMMNYLIEKGADVEWACGKGVTALIAACSSAGCKTEVLELLLSKGANIHAKTKYNYSVVWHAMSYSKPEQLKFLISHGATIDEELKELQLFFDVQQPEMVDFLLMNGANINTRNSYNQSQYDALINFVYSLQCLEILDKHIDKMDEELKVQYMEQRLQLLINA
ncbi:ankyrin repeat domain-containing protein [Bacillus cereus group sp. TH152-1LC]|uniref:ankyrin repeat domain-containing protein n=1 Tax=Bacillus cereus group sp. TH152-1LC TaxID=3018060 RepID=UPI0022E8DCEC|nr:ankyrin repeat domain-containing protein [Bacillus cereus group sp. TH152-1LC]MDA1675517.1 ankyrin repeat domain-containing protein [Bacillus cereus group sp. TH152-1LC]